MDEKNMIEVLERQQALVERLKQANMDEMVDVIEELTAMSGVVKSHITSLKKFVDGMRTENFNYDKEQSKYVRV